MARARGGGLTSKEKAFCLYYFDTRQPGLSAINAGYPEKHSSVHAHIILSRPKVQAYLRKLWDKAESPIVMSVRERKETLSEIGRSRIGDYLTKEGDIDWELVRKMPAVKEVTIDETILKSGIEARTIRVKLLNPIESIHELNIMDKLLNRPEGDDALRVVNFYVTGEEVKEKLGRIGDRTQKAIALTGEKEESE